MPKVLILYLGRKRIFLNKEKKRRILATENTEILFYKEKKKIFWTKSKREKEDILNKERYISSEQDARRK